MQKLRILAHDPGSKNYGIAVLEVQIGARNSPPKNLKFKVLDFWKVENTLQSLKLSGMKGKKRGKTRREKVKFSPEAELASYFAEVQHATHAYDIDVQIAERYMSRRMGGVTIELVNMELGVLRTLCMIQGTPLRLIPASQWKNEAGRQGIDLEDIYAKVKPVSPHEVDATMIGLYGVYSLMKWKPYQSEGRHHIRDSLISQIKKGRKG